MIPFLPLEVMLKIEISTSKDARESFSNSVREGVRGRLGRHGPREPLEHTC